MIVVRVYRIAYIMLHFVNITEKQFLSAKRLYKHLPLEYALKTLENKTLWFANPKEWEDPFESRFLNATYTKSGKIIHFLWVDRLFCTCMSRTSSSEAFWKVYGYNQICLELRINRKALLDELKKLTNCDIYIGRVEYMLTSDITKPLKEIPFDPPCEVDSKSREFAARLFLLKRIAFQYENEIRIIVVSPDKTKKPGIEIPFSCNHTDLINQIVIDPTVGDLTFKMLKQWLADQYGFKTTAAGAPCVIKSQLYTKVKQETLSFD